MKTVFITGASGGIGKAVAEKFAANGYFVGVGYYKNERAAKGLAEAINGLAVNKFIVSYASFVLLLLKEFNEEIVFSIGFIHKRICDAGSLRHVYDLILVILVTLSERNIPLTSDKSFHCQGLQFLQ